MKKTVIFFFALCTVIILCISGAGAEEWSDSELEDVLDEWFGQIFISEGEISQEAYSICYMAPMWEEPVCLCGEKITNMSVRFASGYEAMKAVLDCGNDENGRWVLYLRFPEFPVPGEYVFHVAAFSDNHSFEKDCTLRVEALTIQLFRYKGNDTMYIEPGKKYTVAEVLSNYFQMPPESFDSCAGSAQFECDDQDIRIDYGLNEQNIGEWFLDHEQKLTGKLVCATGNAAIILNHVAFDSIANRVPEAEGHEGLPETQAELQDLPEEEFKRLDDLFSRYIFGTYYTSASLENVQTDAYSVEEDWTAVEYRVIELAGEEAEYCSADFVSGDPFLKGAVRFGTDPETRHVTAGVNNYISGQAGEAVFHLTLRSEHYRMEKDYRLAVTPFPENAFEPKPGGGIVILPGENYTARDLAAMALTLRPELDNNLDGLRFLKYNIIFNSAEEMVRKYHSEKQQERTGELELAFANALIHIPKVKVKQGNGLLILGPEAVCPGSEVIYSVRHTKGNLSLPEDCILTAEGALIDPEGKVRTGKDARPGEQIVITASSEEAGLKASRTVTVKECTWTEPSWTELTVHGITVPVPYEGTLPEIPEPKQYGDDKRAGRISAYDNIDFRVGDLEGSMYYDVHRISEKEVRNHAGDVEGTLLNWQEENRNIMDSGYMYINGYRAAYSTCFTDFDKEYASWQGKAVALVGRDRITVSYWLSGDVKDGILLFDKDFLMDALSRIRIDDIPVEIIDHEPAPDLIQEEGITETSSGATVRYSAGAADPVYGKVVWEITDLKGKATKAATISNGVVKAGNVKKAEQVIVKARYENCLQTAGMELKIWPGVKKISLQASDDFLYLGSDDSLTLNVSGDPQETKLIGLTWSMSKEGIAELKDNGDGTAVLTPVMPGTVTVTAAETAGKKAAVKITVTDKPVTSVEITMKGKAAPGKTVTLSAKLAPDRPARKDVSWSIDADSSIATIDARGQMKIAKDAPAGTVIRVTCTALGAAQPVEATMDLTIE